ncbi:unnamed protein product, partial [Adineta steineri]
QSILVDHININAEWKQHGITVAGGNVQGNQLNQLDLPCGIYVDDDHQTIYVADYANDRIVEWKYGAKNGQVVAGGNGKGNRSNQLYHPTDVIVDKKNDSIIICDRGNRRVVRWSRQNGKNGKTIISDIDCRGLAMDNNGDLYVSDTKKNEVRRWKQGERKGTIVAGGNGQGNHLNQLNWPTYIFVDGDHSVYVSDYRNHRVMKWMKGAKEGIVAAGGNGRGNALTQLCHPQGVTVNHWGNIYVADSFNNRIMRWSQGSCEGSIVVGKYEKAEQSSQLNRPSGLSFDVEGNLYIVDCYNNRVKKLDMGEIPPKSYHYLTKYLPAGIKDLSAETEDLSDGSENLSDESVHLPLETEYLPDKTDYLPVETKYRSVRTNPKDFIEFEESHCNNGSIPTESLTNLIRLFEIDDEMYN